MSITGHQKVFAKLRNLKSALADDSVFQDAGKSWIEDDFLPTARDLVPKVTGNLERSIEGEVAGKEIILRATAPYAEEVELGGNGPAQPFMYPAIEKNKSELVRKMRAGVERKLK